MKCAKIEVTVNLPGDDDDDVQFNNCTLEHAFERASEAHPNWSSIVLIVVRS